jgi:hypothetical protein
VKLIKYDRARKALAEAHRVDEVKGIRDKAVAIVAYARQVKDRDMIIWASEIKIRAERRMGELLRETAAAGQRQVKGGTGTGRPSKTRGSQVSSLPSLKDMGISRDQSKDAQALAKIPEVEFEERLAHAARDPVTMTAAKLLRPVPKPVAEDPFKQEREIWAGVSGWLHNVRRLPDMKTLRSVRPTGGARTALGGYFEEARQYLDGLKSLHEEGWF